MGFSFLLPVTLFLEELGRERALLFYKIMSNGSGKVLLWIRYRRVFWNENELTWILTPVTIRREATHRVDQDASFMSFIERLERLGEHYIRYFKVRVAFVFVGEQLQNSWDLPTAGKMNGSFVNFIHNITLVHVHLYNFHKVSNYFQ